MKPLNPRQRQIMQHVADGYTNEQIGEAVGISVMTVKNTLTMIYKKMGARNRAHAATIFTLYDGRFIERAEDV